MTIRFQGFYVTMQATREAVEKKLATVASYADREGVSKNPKSITYSYDTGNGSDTPHFGVLIDDLDYDQFKRAKQQGTILTTCTPEVLSYYMHNTPVLSETVEL